MIWIAPTEKNTGNAALEKRLQDAADLLLPRLLSGQVELSEAGLFQ